MILILSNKTDVHALAVASYIKEAGVESTIFDIKDMASSTDLDFELSSTGEMDFSIKSSTQESFCFSDVHSIWWRRPDKLQLSDIYPHPTLQNFARKEWVQAWVGGLASTQTFMLNPIKSREASRFKSYQLKVAAKIGLTIPKTLITNSAAKAEAFIASNQPCIYKPFTGTDFGFFETRRFSTKEDLDELSKIKSCPLVIQEEIKGGFDVRVTVVGGKVFAAKIDYLSGKHGIDSRVEDLPIETHTLPHDISKKLLTLVSELGLHYGAIDLRCNSNGEYIFLEINPDGQYLWTEIEAGLEISRSIAEILMNPPTPRLCT